MIEYKRENDLSAGEFRDVLVRSTLGERRPIDDPGAIESMLRHANLIITARDNKRLVGVARSLTDFAFCTYLSDLCVDEEYQKKGIGKQLIRETKTAAPDGKLLLLAAPKAIHYYGKIGMIKFDQCFTLENESQLK
ncbi:MAG TPA: GNAT family N-acetyltransferase [Chryseolinea sp.]|nr:GNAT family N-acetyltransferase [Chryseolinea sp.]